LKVSAWPAPSTAAQKVALGQETDASAVVPSMPTGALHELPLKVSARPAPSTAAQKVALGQETEFSAVLPSMLTGALHELPLKVSARPAPSTAAQNEVVGQEIEVREPPLSMRAGVLQALALKVDTYPSRSTALQTDADGHDTDEAGKAGSGCEKPAHVPDAASAGQHISITRAQASSPARRGRRRCLKSPSLKFTPKPPVDARPNSFLRARPPCD
jgi:hypothetical protein